MCTLRRLRTADAHAIFTSIDTQREHLGQWLPFVATEPHTELLSSGEYTDLHRYLLEK